MGQAHCQKDRRATDKINIIPELFFPTTQGAVPEPLIRARHDSLSRLKDTNTSGENKETHFQQVRQFFSPASWNLCEKKNSLLLIKWAISSGCFFSLWRNHGYRAPQQRRNVFLQCIVIQSNNTCIIISQWQDWTFKKTSITFEAVKKTRLVLEWFPSIFDIIFAKDKVLLSRFTKIHTFSSSLGTIAWRAKKRFCQRDILIVALLSFLFYKLQSSFLNEHVLFFLCLFLDQ